MGRWGEVDKCVEVRNGLGSIRGEWLALRVTMGKVSDTTRGTATRRASHPTATSPPFFVFTLVGWSPKSKNSPDLGHFKISLLGKTGPPLGRA